jgi:hypothetical protein
MPLQNPEYSEFSQDPNGVSIVIEQVLNLLDRNCRLGAIWF